MRFILFFGLFCAILLTQMQPDKIFSLDEALRQRVVDESGALQNDVTVLEDLYGYLTDQIMPNVFPASWYNDDAFTTAESGYILNYNKLVGGLLIVQERGTATSPCREPYYPGFRSAYEVMTVAVTVAVTACNSHTAAQSAVASLLTPSSLPSAPECAPRGHA